MGQFKLDENLPVEAAELLQATGHDALTVLDQALGGHPDDSLAAICRKERRAIVTFDLDFSRTFEPIHQKNTSASWCFGFGVKKRRTC